LLHEPRRKAQIVSIRPVPVLGLLVDFDGLAGTCKAKSDCADSAPALKLQSNS
jgi:hypothetical protein